MSAVVTPPLQLNPSPHGSSGRRRRNRYTIFSQHSKVEVRTDEEDFRGVYFTATVLRAPFSPGKGSKKKSKRLYVEYHNLLANDNGSERLKESVEVSFVRPAPPEWNIKDFAPNDAVDAFYKDGWWTGVISGVVEAGKRYIVTFQYPPDELEFDFSDLRAHSDWVDGRWIRAGDQSTTGLMFDVGTKVEVSLEGENDQGAWFPATIREDLGGGAFLVEYFSSNTDNGVQAHKVTINSPNIRPCPLVKNSKFAVLEKVDAFFDFCWSTGVITKELENNRYLVFFKQMKRKKEFNESELRPHMEWKDGKWSTSSQHQIILREEGSRRTLPFLTLLCMCHKLSQDASIPSSDVEINECHLHENSSASVVVDVSSGDGKDKSSKDVSGKHRQSTDDKSTKDVPGIHAQTTADKSSKDVPGTHEQSAVDKAYKDVPGTHEQSAVDKASKDVPETHEQSAVDKASKDVPGTHEQSAVDKPSKDVPGAHEQSAVDKASKDIPGTDDQTTVDKSSKDMPGTDDQTSADKSSKDVPGTDGQTTVDKSFKDVPGTDEQTTADKSSENLLSDSASPVSIVNAPSSAAETVTSKGRRDRRKRKYFDKIESYAENVSNSVKRSSELKWQPETPVPVVGGKDLEGVGNALVVQDVLSRKCEIPVVIGLPCTEMSSSGSKNKRARLLNHKNKQVHDLTVQEVKGDIQLGLGELSDKKKRGKTKTMLLEDIHTPEKGISQNGDGDLVVLDRHDDDPQRNAEVEMLGEKATFPNERILPKKDKLITVRFVSKNEKESIGKRILSKMLPGEETTRSQGNHTSKKGRKQIAAQKSVPQVQDPLNTSGVKSKEVNHGDIEMVEVVGGPPLHGSCDDEPLSKWIEVIHSPPITDSSKPSPVSTVEQCMGNDKQRGDCVIVQEGESMEQLEQGEMASDMVSSEQQTLPFTKNTVLWKTIESMDAFKNTPQRPHFQPLEQFKESLREGFAIGCMVTFCSVVEKTRSLKFSDPKSVTDDILETLVDLESHGFDVKALKERVNELHVLKDKCDKLVDEVKVLNNQIVEHHYKKDEIAEEINDINEQIKKLQEKLSVAESAKGKEDDQIAMLEGKLMETEEIIQNMEIDFDEHASRL